MNKLSLATEKEMEYLENGRFPDWSSLQLIPFINFQGQTPKYVDEKIPSCDCLS
jgi:hypothetical protein